MESKKSIFVLMPFLDEFDDVYLVIKDATSAASAALGITIHCLRADEIAEPGRITEQIIHQIEKADLLIADLSGNNPNVMYELGYGHALKKPAIIINQNVHTSPFDVKDFRQILYNRNRLMKDCRPSLLAAIQDVFGKAGREGLTATTKTIESSTSATNEATSGTGPIRPSDQLVAALQKLHLRLQFANAKHNTNDVRAAADEVKRLLSRVTVASTGDKQDMANTAAIAGNCAVEMERAELSDDAETVYRRALGLFPDYAGLHLQYGDFLIDAGRLDEAREEFERAKSLHSDKHERRLQLFEMKLALKSGTPSPEVGVRLKEEFEKQPGDRMLAAAYLTYLHEIKSPLDDFEKACAKWKEAAKHDSKWEADRSLADHLAVSRDPDHTKRAVKIYEVLIESKDLDDEDQAGSLHNLAQLYERLGDRDRAKATFNAAYKLRPGDPAIRAVFSQMLSQWGDIEGAMNVAEGKPLPN